MFMLYLPYWSQCLAVYLAVAVTVAMYDDEMRREESNDEHVTELELQYVASKGPTKTRV
jgi:hypothetical protein